MGREITRVVLANVRYDWANERLIQAYECLRLNDVKKAKKHLLIARTTLNKLIAGYEAREDYCKDTGGEIDVDYLERRYAQLYALCDK